MGEIGASEERGHFSPGAVIKARNRLWRVDDVQESVLTATAIDGEAIQRRFYLPFEAIKPGKLESPDPDRLGNPASQDLLLRAYRLSLLHGSAPLLSLQRSSVIPTNYQLVPIVMALDSPKVRLLVADDVGMGKSIEAGLVITELMARHRAQRILLVLPANLRQQWKDAMSYFFHVDFRIISTQHRREMERQLPAGANPWEFYDRLITSVDYAKSPGIKNQILEQSWDLVLFDEAHQEAKPHQGSADQTVDMDRWKLAEELSSKAQHVLFLTATPHNGYTDSFASLLRMLNPEVVEGPVHDPRILKNLAKKHVCQRRRKDVEQWFKAEGRKSPFPIRDQDEVIIDLTETEERVLESVENYGQDILKAAEAMKRGAFFARWTVMHFHKRALSSPAALRQSLKNRQKALLQKLKGQGTQEELSIPETVAKATVIDEDPGERFTDEEASERVDRQLFVEGSAIEHELSTVRDLLERAQAITPAKDSKLQRLLKTELRARLKDAPKVIIFTRYLDTLNYLEEQIGKSELYKDCKVVTLYGDLNEPQRREKFSDFERTKKAVMVATDCISEGINLQHACSQVIHYELPWNPNRLEQRNGRVDRFGQPKEKVYIRTLVMNDALDVTILKVLVEKSNEIRDEFGFAPPFFGDDTCVLDLIRQRGLHVRLPKVYQRTLWDALEDRSPEPVLQDPFSKEALSRIKEDSFYGHTEVALPDVEERLQETWRTVGSPEQIQRFVLSGLDRFRCSVKTNDDGTLRVVVSHPALQSSQTGGVIEKATFNPEKALGNPDTTCLDLGHPLVRRLLEQVKLSALKEEGFYGRTAKLTVEGIREVTAVLHLLVRYVVNAEPVHIIEELTPLGLPLYAENLLTAEPLGVLLDSPPLPDTRTPQEVQEDLRRLMGREDLETIINGAVETRRKALVQERRTLQQQVLTAQGPDQAKWVKGLDDLSIGSCDLLTACLYYPSLGSVR